MVGLVRYVPHFPSYARAIARKINMERKLVNLVTGDEYILDNAALFDEESFGNFLFWMEAILKVILLVLDQLVVMRAV